MHVHVHTFVFARTGVGISNGWGGEDANVEHLIITLMPHAVQSDSKLNRHG